MMWGIYIYIYIFLSGAVKPPTNMNSTESKSSAHFLTPGMPEALRVAPLRGAGVKFPTLLVRCNV